jgi:ornithine carbamoyltransferase
MRHFLSFLDLPPADLAHLLTRAARLKAEQKQRVPNTLLAGQVWGLVFEKPSLRTRVSFESAITQMGGTSLFFPGSEVGLGWRETLADFMRTMNHYVDGLVLRVFRHETIETLTRYATVPIINGLSDLYHPCQAIADVLTIQELFGSVANRRVVFVGDGNNVSRSLAIACGKLGAKFTLAAPDGYRFDAGFLDLFQKSVPGASIEQTSDPIAAVRQADIIYADVWTSMGQEAEREERLKRFAGFQINTHLLMHAPASAKVLHCLPAHRGEEITDDIMDSDRAAVFQQAGNRLHGQKAILEWLMS